MDMECVLDSNCLLLKELFWEDVKYSSLGYGMYFSLLYLSFIENSAGESVKYCSTRMWNTFQAVIMSY